MELAINPLELSETSLGFNYYVNVNVAGVIVAVPHLTPLMCQNGARHLPIEISFWVKDKTAERLENKYAVRLCRPSDVFVRYLHYLENQSFGTCQIWSWQTQ